MKIISECVDGIDYLEILITKREYEHLEDDSIFEEFEVDNHKTVNIQIRIK